MISEVEVRRKLFALLRENISLEEFEAWLVPQSWNMHRDSLPAARRLVGEIELSLAEYSNGHLDEDEVREILWSLVNTVSVSLILDPATGASPRSASILTATWFQAGSPQNRVVLALS